MTLKILVTSLPRCLASLSLVCNLLGGTFTAHLLRVYRYIDQMSDSRGIRILAGLSEVGNGGDFSTSTEHRNCG